MGARAKDGSQWIFDITPLAKRWASLQLFDEGIALIPIDAGIHRTWTVEFHGGRTVLQNDDDEIETVSKKDAARAAVDFIPVAASPPVSPGGFPGGLPSPGGDQGTFPSFETPPAPAPVEPPVESVTPPIPQSPVVPLGTVHTPAWLIGLFPLGLLGLGLVSTALGSDGVVETTKTNRVASILRVRRLSGAEGLSETQAIAGEEERTLEQ
jgi:hypothetical protein